MDQKPAPLTAYYAIRLEQLKENLEKNGFEAYVTASPEEARSLVMELLLPACAPRTVAFGGSATVVDCGLYDAVKESGLYDVLDTLDPKLPANEKLELRRQALLCDAFLTGANAVTEDGMLVNLDMIGNRVGAVAFGPRSVIVVAGRNKMVADLNEAIARIKNHAAPANAIRLRKKTPCVKTARCMQCDSPDRICNVWTITEKSFPKARIKVVLVNAEMGL